MNMMTTHTLERSSAESHNITDIAASTAATCLATRVRQLSRIITRVYDDAMRPLGITASQYTLLAQLASRDGITAVEIGHELDIEKSTLSRNLKRLLALGHIIMDPPAGRRGTRGPRSGGRRPPRRSAARAQGRRPPRRSVSSAGAGRCSERRAVATAVSI